MKVQKFYVLASVVLAVLAFSAVTYAGVPVVIGDYVWFDANGNGQQDDGANAGINDVQVLFFRDYDCNGIIDGYDELYDYDFTSNDAAGNPGYYQIAGYSSFCFVAFLNESTVPADLIHTTATELGVGQSTSNQFWVDFGLGYKIIHEADFVCPKTIGFWKQQFTAKKSAKYTPAELAAIVDLALELTPVFDSYEEFPYYLNINGNAGPLARAKKQFAGLTLNLAAYELRNQISFKAGMPDFAELNSVLTDAETVSEAYTEIESYILDGKNLALANDLADAINNGVGLDTTCAD